ncbi:hypothetical protein CVS41_15935 [Aeromonas veronii]|nr:hypothetical protein CVS41_15935 [Aeromonas veronii]
MLVEAILQLSNTAWQLIYELVGLLEGQRVNCLCRMLYGHARKQYGRDHLQAEYAAFPILLLFPSSLITKLTVS